MSKSIRIATFALALMAGTAGAMADTDGYRYQDDYTGSIGSSTESARAFWDNQARNGS